MYGNLRFLKASSISIRWIFRYPPRKGLPRAPNPLGAAQVDSPATDLGSRTKYSGFWILYYWWLGGYVWGRRLSQLRGKYFSTRPNPGGKFGGGYWTGSALQSNLCGTGRDTQPRKKECDSRCNNQSNSVKWILTASSGGDWYG